MARAEREWCRRVSLNVAVSQEDASRLGTISGNVDVFVVPNGVDTRALEPSTSDPTGDIVFVGGYSWFPNADGMEFFAYEILPRLRRTIPGVRVRWIGRAPTEVIDRFRGLGVDMLGYVDDMRPEVHRARCVIVPLRIGGGTRLKILDAWALGKAVVSTSVGCEGLATESGRNILIADTPHEFAAEVVRVLSERSLRARLEAEARRTAIAHYDWETLGETMRTRYSSLLGGGPAPTPIPDPRGLE